MSGKAYLVLIEHSDIDVLSLAGQMACFLGTAALNWCVVLKLRLLGREPTARLFTRLLCAKITIVGTGADRGTGAHRPLVHPRFQANLTL